MSFSPVPLKTFPSEKFEEITVCLVYHVNAETSLKCFFNPFLVFCCSIMTGLLFIKRAGIIILQSSFLSVEASPGSRKDTSKQNKHPCQGQDNLRQLKLFGIFSRFKSARTIPLDKPSIGKYTLIFHLIKATSLVYFNYR